LDDTAARQYRFGVVCLLTSTLFTSLAGILLRLVEAAGGWQILFYRSLAFVATLLTFLAWRHRRATLRAFRAVGRNGLLAGVLLSGAFVCFIFALLATTVANVVFTVSLTPFVAALLGWLLLREAVSALTLGAMAVCFAGVAIMVGGGLASGGIDGILLALGSCLFYSSTLVALRRGRAGDMLPAVCLAGVFCGALAAVMAPDLAVGGHDLLLAVLLGVVQLGFQYILVTTATRFVPAAEAALIGRLTLVLAPLWVWLGVGEMPGEATLIGGGVVAAAVFAHGFLSLRRARRV